MRTLYLIFTAMTTSFCRNIGPMQAIFAGTNGHLLSRKSHKYVSAKESIAKIVGTEPMESRSGGYLLED